MSEATTNETNPAAGSGSAEAGGGAQKKRPAFLTVLCVLTFIGSGLGLISFLAMAVGMGSLMSFMGDMGGASSVGNAGTAYFAVSALLAAGTLFGAIMMWKLKKTGFYLYTAASVIAFLLPLFFGMSFSVMGAVVAVIFIVLYGLNLKHME